MGCWSRLLFFFHKLVLYFIFKRLKAFYWDKNAFSCVSESRCEKFCHPNNTAMCVQDPKSCKFLLQFASMFCSLRILLREGQKPSLKRMHVRIQIWSNGVRYVYAKY